MDDQDIKRKLSIAGEALQWAHEMLHARDVMNAKVHCAPVRLSPITERVQQAIQAIDKEERPIVLCQSPSECV